MTCSGLEMLHIAKSYGVVHALRGASLRGSFGEVHGLVGENGAGKSTLVKVLSGAVAPDDGRVVLNDRELRLASPGDAVAAGIGTVFQELSLIPDLSIAANLLYGREPQVRFGRVNQPALLKEARRALEEHGLDYPDLRRPVARYGSPSARRCEIVKTLMRRKVLIPRRADQRPFPQQVDWLFQAVRQFAANGGLVLFISHRMAEVQAICDTVTVFRTASTWHPLRPGGGRVAPGRNDAGTVRAAGLPAARVAGERRGGLPDQRPVFATRRLQTWTSKCAQARSWG